MSYTPTTWESADVVSAVRMNALEQAVGDMNMSYTPNTWQNGDVLTAEKMNALEQAVASGGGGGSSDFSTATITFDAVGGYYTVYLSAIDNNGDLRFLEQEIHGTTTFHVPLYNGKAILMYNSIKDIDGGVMPTLTGDVEMGADGLVITGDGSITATGTA